MERRTTLHGVSTRYVTAVPLRDTVPSPYTDFHHPIERICMTVQVIIVHRISAFGSAYLEAAIKLNDVGVRQFRHYLSLHDDERYLIVLFDEILVHNLDRKVCLRLLILGVVDFRVGALTEHGAKHEILGRHWLRCS